MDEADAADKAIEDDLRLAVLQAQAAKPEAYPRGYCLLDDCNEPVPEGHRWCNAECRNMWEKLRKRPTD